MSGSSGVGDAINWFSRLFGSGSGVGAGAAAPGMAEAGYGLAPGLTEAAVDPSSPTFSSKGLGDALKNLGGASGSTGKAAGAGDRPPMPGNIQGGGIGRPTAQSLTPLLQLLNQRRDQLLQSATGGVGAGQAQGARPTAGLLGF